MSRKQLFSARGLSCREGELLGQANPSGEVGFEHSLSDFSFWALHFPISYVHFSYLQTFPCISPLGPYVPQGIGFERTGETALTIFKELYKFTIKYILLKTKKISS